MATRKVEAPTHRGTMVDGTTGAAMTITIRTEAQVKERDIGTVGRDQHGRKVVARVSLGTSSSTGLCGKITPRGPGRRRKSWQK